MKQWIKSIVVDVVFVGLLVAAIYYGQVWAGRVAVFLVWFFFVLMLLLVFNIEEFRGKGRKKLAYRTETWKRWNMAATAVLVLFLVTHAWWFTAIGLGLAHLFGSMALDKMQEEVRT